MESAVTAPVSGHIKRVVVQEGKVLHLPCYSLALIIRSRGFNRARRPNRGNRTLRDRKKHKKNMYKVVVVYSFAFLNLRIPLA